MPKLKNLDHGLWHGKLIDEVRQNQPKIYRHWRENPELACPPEGESIAVARERAQSAIAKILKKHRQGTIALVIPEPLASVVRGFLRNNELDDLWQAETDIGGWTLIEIQQGEVPANGAPNGPAGRPSSGDAMKRQKRGVPEGLWQRCPGCQEIIFRKEAERRLGVCPECEYHFYVSARDRIQQVLDDGTFEEWDADLRPTDPLGFSDKKRYAERLVEEQARTGLTDAALTGTGMIRARRVAFGVTDSAFIMGSMGSVVGERSDAAHRTLDRTAAAPDHHQRIGRWSPHARGHSVADADGQSLGGTGPL